MFSHAALYGEDLARYERGTMEYTCLRPRGAGAAIVTQNWIMHLYELHYRTRALEKLRRGPWFYELHLE